MYIGSTVDFSERWAKHKWLLRKGLHSNIHLHLQRAWNKDSEDLFEFSVVEYVTEGPEAWVMREQYYTDLWNPEYAIRKECVSSSLGCKLSIETKEKISNTLVGRIFSEEVRFNMRKSIEQKQQMSLARKGKSKSEEHRQNISKSLMGNTRTLGKHFVFSDEHKEKLRKPKSEETKKKMTEAKKKWWMERKLAAQF